MDYSEDNRKQKGICPCTGCRSVGILQDSKIALKSVSTPKNENGFKCIDTYNSTHIMERKNYYKCIRCGYEWTETCT